jgi:photosystem II stability/assembly factor-like uncharacterized protein
MHSFLIALQTVILFSLTSADLSAQWSTQTSGTTNDLRGVSFTDINNGAAVGQLGTILKTIDGGTNWIQQTSGTTNDLRGVSFTNTDVGTAVGQLGIILRTTDGGVNWVEQTSGVSTIWLERVFFIDANNGWVVGQAGTILKTTNGGANWSEQTSGTTEDLRDISFTDADNGFAVGQSGTILKTTDGGANWMAQTSGTTNNLVGVSFTSASTGTVVGVDGIILKTTNGGINWVEQTSGTPQWLLGVSFTDSNFGDAVGTGGANLRTTDGGTTWTQQTNAAVTLYDVSFTDASTGTVVGESGTILRMNNPLPVELVSFTGSVEEANVSLRWITSTQLNNKGFEVERKQGSEGYQTLIFIKGDGTTTEQKLYSYTDKGLEIGNYTYRLKQIDYDGSVNYLNEINVSVNNPAEFSLLQNYPNPFNPSTTINYSLPQNASVKLVVYDILGKEVRTLVNSREDAGRYQVQWNGLNNSGHAVSTGIYIYRINAGDFVHQKKMMFMK